MILTPWLATQKLAVLTEFLDKRGVIYEYQVFKEFTIKKIFQWKDDYSKITACSNQNSKALLKTKSLLCAGAGSIIECLRLRKELVVVVNDKLMDNHQLELAEALEQEGFLKKCLVGGLEEVLACYPLTDLLEYPEPNVSAFGRLVDDEVFKEIEET